MVNLIIKLASVLTAFGRGAVIAIVALGSAPVLAADPADVAATGIMPNTGLSGDADVLGYNLESTGMRSGIGPVMKSSAEPRPVVANRWDYNAKSIRFEYNGSNDALSSLRKILDRQLIQTRFSFGRNRMKVQLLIGF